MSHRVAGNSLGGGWRSRRGAGGWRITSSSDVCCDSTSVLRPCDISVPCRRCVWESRSRVALGIARHYRRIWGGSNRPAGIPCPCGRIQPASQRSSSTARHEWACYNRVSSDAGWSSPVARWAHNPKVAGSNPAPATITTCSERSPVSGDLFAFVAAPSIAARFPFSSICSSPWLGVRTMASIRPRSAACFDLVAAGGQVVVATTLVAGPETPEPVLRRHDESGAADAALRQTREQVDRPALSLCKGPADAHLIGDRRVALVV
jgi:hypothetical protein